MQHADGAGGLAGHACLRSPASEGRQLSSSSGISRDRGGPDHTELPRPESPCPPRGALIPSLILECSPAWGRGRYKTQRV